MKFNFVPCVLSNFLIFVTSKLLGAKTKESCTVWRPQAHWAFDPGPMVWSITPTPYTRQGPRPRATMHDPMPIEPVILTWTHLEAQFRPLPINYILDGNVIARGYHVSAARYYLREYRYRTTFWR